MKKRTFLKLTGAAGAGLLVAPFAGCGPSGDAEGVTAPEATPGAGEQTGKRPKLKLHEQAPLGYAYDALAPVIDAETMELHYSKHHAGYVRNLNAAVRKAPEFEGLHIDELLGRLNESDAHVGLRNNGGGHFNHTLYWKLLTPGGASAPSGKFKAAIDDAFGSTANMLEALRTAGAKQFGSGWVWLIERADGRLAVTSTPNQDNPLMTQIVEAPGRPIIGVDVWEHAYYLNYQNRRGDYLQAFTEVLNWDAAAAVWAEGVA